ncbi:hypothetical protein DEF23_12645 [Marinitenerispora sediminis]|uniref:Uncharacterized protein n=1 Tax=Marinitenerispora sediminis TaxID=1931232 RepID=A0A368T510_9ACTN|nr:hypothetical protein DEF28_17365 [Marinitenerispora sediminis]RCV56360.1 hypothetical protein DEF23_12645 [Marinitenerispora sediminis]RCV58695.1 hypothetical protein DEF24_12475 [Marinitenerispora sediminis]
MTPARLSEISLPPLRRSAALADVGRIRGHAAHNHLPWSRHRAITGGHVGKHDDKSQWDGHKPDAPPPPPTPDSGGSGGGRHERDDDDK